MPMRLAGVGQGPASTSHWGKHASTGPQVPPSSAGAPPPPSKLGAPPAPPVEAVEDEEPPCPVEPPAAVSTETLDAQPAPVVPAMHAPSEPAKSQPAGGTPAPVARSMRASSARRWVIPCMVGLRDRWSEKGNRTRD